MISQTGLTEEPPIEVRRRLGGEIMSLTNDWSRVKVFLLSAGKVSSRKRFLYGLMVLGLFFGVAGPVRCQFLYYSSAGGGYIRRVNLDGTGQVTLISGLDGPAGPTLDLAAGQMYWADTNAGTIRRANLDGSGVTTLVSGLPPSGPMSPSAFEPALDLARGQMYWTDGVEFGPGSLRRANLDGSDVTTLVTGLRGAAGGVVLDLAAGQMYWGEGQAPARIQRANLDGSGLTTLLQVPVTQVALDIPGGKMYWTSINASHLMRANLDGSGQEILVQNQDTPISIALDLAGGQMYWGSLNGGDIRRANLDGSGQEVLLRGTGRATQIALDLGAPGTAVFFAITAPASVPPGTPFDVTVTALDPYGNTAVNYQGTVTFSTSDTDPDIVLPADYTFTADDHGVHTFSGAVTLSTPGDQTITVTDTASGMTRTVTVTIVAPN
jgi:hypothetical protein